ncbi:hypothetical protein M2347_000001, partial [Chryseobacterium sp. H1D6B]|uniref:DUF6443 domain-containing protein n=1 Tax=Chryseobacterium sp. H1D6B TaxID=2940588 RepID=UPI002476E14C
MKKIITLFSVLFAAGLSYAQTNTENYIQSISCLDADCVKKIETVQYFDFLGRPKQVVNVKGTPSGKDLVTPVVYDELGRKTRDYLPVPQSSTAGGAVYPQSSGLVPYPVSDAAGFYAGEKIYTEKVLESSPLERVLEQKQTGNAWAGRSVKFSYDVNSTADQVKKFETVTIWNTADKIYESQLRLSSGYLAGELSKNTVTDEDGNKTIEFKDGFGQTVLVRKAVSATENADTYYVYNEYMQLAFVIPPLASAAAAVDNTVLADLCYQYKYDSRQRLAEKKLPGKGWEYMVYDKQDRLVMSQDAVMKPAGKWLFTKYDKFSRVVYSGTADIGAWFSRAQIQESVNYYIGQGQPSAEARSQSGFTSSNMTVYYGNTVYPTTIDKILTVNYYDTYPPLSGDVAVPASIMNQEVLKQPGQSTAARNTRTLPLASYLKNIEDDNWTKKYTYYDSKGRPIGSYTSNHLGGYTKTETELDFAGAVKQTKAYHKRLVADTEKVITETFEYDAQNRLKKQYHQISGQPQELLAENTYNEISQLSNKKVGNNLQSIDYAYNIRGWMTKINDPASLSGKLFGYEIKYTSPVAAALAPGRYNGNIAEIDWKTSQDGILRRYSYQYDSLNRLKNGIYSEPDSSVPQNKLYNESMDYDQNGNIASLKRNGRGASGMAEQIDDLAYHYTGNRLTSVTDTSSNYQGYPDASGNTIAYDENGNMKNEIDKGLLELNYNFLNLPKQIKFESSYIIRNPATGENELRNIRTEYTYRADGAKLRKKYTNFFIKNSTERITVTDYLDGFQYTVNYLGAVSLDFVPTAEGYYNFKNNKYIYNYTDHLGNVRLSYLNNGSGAEVLEENNYYPFGLKHEGYNVLNGNPAYKYKYN